MEIGRVAQIARYPVKSMMGEQLETALMTEHGIEGDRIYALVQKNPPNERFPWMTAREAHEMLLFKPRYTGNRSDIEVTSLSGATFSVGGDEILSYFRERYAKELILRYDESGCKDSKPVSLIGLPTVEALGKEVGLRLAPERFRANLYAKWDSDKPFFEDALVGKVLQIGKAEIRIAKKDSRCVIPTLDPTSAIPAPELLETIKKNHSGYAGAYAFVEKPGEIRKGDPIGLSD